IDVLVNNAANSQMGYCGEISPEAFERQLATNLLGPLNVTRAVLPVMRKQRSGHVISISSTAGIVGWEFTSAYAASKFGLEGWMESLQPEVAPFGIRTTIVEPGFFRTELLEEASVSYGDQAVEDYADRTAEQLEWWKAQNGQQAGDPAKLGRALVTMAGQEQPPLRFVAGADAVAVVEQKAADLKEQVEAYRELSASLALDELAPAGSARQITMRATVMFRAGDVRIENVPDAHLIEPTDALVRVTRACICGSDPGPYNLMEPSETGQRMGREFIGIVDAAGADVGIVRAGDVVVAPFAWSDGTCVFCREGLHTSCLHGGWWAREGIDGG